MASDLLEIIIKAQDQASDAAKKVDDQLAKIGDTAQKSNDKAARASQQLQQKTGLTGKEVTHLSEKFRQVGENGKSSFNKLSKSEQDALVKFNMLDKGSQNLLQHINKIGNANMSGMQGAISDAKSKFQSLEGVTKTWSGSLDYSRSKLQLLGTNTDSLKGKIQVVGNSIPTYLGSKWDIIKPKVTGLSNHIKSSLSNAVSTVRSKIQSLGNSFSGLGGVISSAIGGLGMASISQLTVGLSLSREKMSSLNTAIMGSASASKSLLDSIDDMTNKSVVSMDQMVNAMNKIKLSTQMSNSELSNTKEVVMKLGEASMLMGNDAETAAYQMGEAFSGLNGDFQILKENFGITKEKMKDAGWDGSAEDVKGYTDALEECLKGLGDLGGVMDTNSGKIETVKKKFRTAGRTLGDMLTPYLGQAADAFLNLEDQFPGMTQGLIGVAGGVSLFATVAPSINGVFTAVDNGMSILKGTGEIIRGVGSAVGIMASAEELAGAAAGASAAGHAAAATAEEIEAGAASGAAVSTWALVWPVLAVIAAIAGIAIVVYEAGKAFGWWSDVGDMVAAITAGIKRLWSAFINNPDVQGLIKSISDAWAWIAPQIEPAIQGVLEFLGVSSNGEFDIVRAIIMAVGGAFHTVADMVRGAIPYLQAAWDFLSWLVGSAINIGQGIYNGLKPIVCILLGCSPGIVPALQMVWDMFTSVWNAIMTIIGPIVGTIVSTIRNLINVFDQFSQGQINLPQLITMVLSLLWNAYLTITQQIARLVLKWGGQLLSYAVKAGRNFVNGIINWIRQLPGKVYSLLISVVSRIVSAIQSWITNAVAKVKQFVTNVVGPFKDIPGKISKALSGVVNAVTKPFSDAWAAVKPYVDKIQGAIDTLGSVANFQAGDGVDTEGNIYSNGVLVGNINTSETGSSSLELNHNLHVTFDFENVPDHVDENNLIQALKSKKVLSAITSNPDFQALDKKVKDSLTNKNRRARGA